MSSEARAERRLTLVHRDERECYGGQTAEPVLPQLELTTVCEPPGCLSLPLPAARSAVAA